MFKHQTQVDKTICAVQNVNLRLDRLMTLLNCRLSRHRATWSNVINYCHLTLSILLI